MQDGLLCRQARTAAGGYVRIGLEAAATIAVPYAGAAMALRAGLVAARTGSALIKGTAMATRAFMPAVLFGSGFSEGLINARDIYDSCAPPEYLASKSFDSCDAEKQMYEVKAEASIAACVLNATLGVGLPVVGVKLAVRGAKKIEAEAEHTVEAVEEATIVVTGRRPSNRAKDALPPSEDRVVKEYGTRKITSTNENQNYAALARVQEKRPGLVFVDSQNGLLKWLNDNVKSKPLIDAFSNRHSQLINIALETYTRRNPGFRLNVYSDYKGIRYGVQGPVGKETKLAEDLKKIIDDVDARFMRELKDGDYPSFNGKAVDEPWFSTGIARTADEANVQARFPPGTSWEKIDETFKSTESIRETLQRRFGDTTLMRAISGNPSKKVLQTEVFEILRKNSDDALAAKILNHRNGTHLRPEDIALLRQYKDEVNLFAPGLLINDRVLHEFKDAVHGGITVDFAGVGAKNIEATAEGLAMGSTLQTAVAATRRMEMRVTTGLDALKANSERAVNAVLAKHGLKGRVTVSGDDMVVIPDGELSPQVRQELVQALAKADQSPADMRVSFFSRGIRRTDDRATIAAEGEGIEKLLRARLEFLFSRAELNGLTIATDMQGATRGTGDVILQTNGGLNPDQQRIIAREFREAVKDNNKKYQTNFSVAE